MLLPRYVLTISLTLASVSGCSLLGPLESTAPSGSSYGASLQPSSEAMSFQRVQQAASLNAAVIYFEGDKSGPKLVRLPPEGQPIYLAGLLEQIKATENGKISASLWRVTPDAPQGAKMAVRFKKNGRIDPLTDYAIRPGDRITIASASDEWFSQLF